jgi:hypothetical protein
VLISAGRYKIIPQESFEDPYKNFQLSFLEKQNWQAKPDGRLSRLGMLVYRRLITKGITPFFMRPFLASRIAKRNLKVIDDLAKVTDSKVVIDSTKSLVRFHLLNRFRPSSLIVLTRDPRGLSNSATKYGRNPERVLEAWIRTYERILTYIETNRINASWVAYEQMCAEPDKVKRFFADKFIGPDAALEPADAFQFHLVAGNPSRYRSFSIREDSSWTKSLPDDIRNNVERQWHRIEKIYQRLESNCETVLGMPPLASFAQYLK